MNIVEGDLFPAFTLKDDKGEDFDLNTLIGKRNIVLYFYPKDETLGCTKQACLFRDSHHDFLELDCTVIGISNDSSKSHNSFRNNHQLQFKLLSDDKGKIRKRMDIPKDIFGLIPGRCTFVINKKGQIIKIIRSSINMEKHINDALIALKADVY